MHEPANHARDSSGPSNDDNDEPRAPGPGPSSVAETASEDLTALRNRGRGLHGCRHYRRRARFITPCCNEEWWCRHCHNEAKYQQEPEWEKKHELDRKRITELVCALCSARQPVSTYCKECGVAFGAYACTICPFFDDDLSKQTYHCDDCGICRVGGRENYFHCATCGSCYAANLRNNHVCVERAMHQNCPVCFEFLFESVDPTTVLRCGHTIHTECLRDLERNTSAICPCCPICKKSLGDYSRFWRVIDAEVAAAPVPPEYRGWTINILCNDCSASSTVPFNLIAHKCTSCGSYNTRRMGITTGGGTVLAEHEAVDGAMVHEQQQGDGAPGGGIGPVFLQAMQQLMAGGNAGNDHVGSDGDGDEDEEGDQEEEEDDDDLIWAGAAGADDHDDA